MLYRYKPIYINKAVFSEENFVPKLQFESVNMLTALYCVTMIHQLLLWESMHRHFGQTLKSQCAVVTVNIRSRSLKSNEFFSVSKQCISTQVWCRKTHWFRRQSSEKFDFTVLKIMTEIRSRSPKSYELFIMSQ